MIMRRRAQKARAITLLGGKCAWCSSTKRLEFDHTENDRVDRRHILSQMWGWSWAKIEAELKKCQLLCASCHGKKTALDHGKGPSAHGTVARYNNERCRCAECRAANASRSRSTRAILAVIG